MKKVVLFVIIIFCLIPMLTQAKDIKSQEEVLLSILDTIGGEYIEGEISANGLLMEKFLSREELDKHGQVIIKDIGLVGIEKNLNSDFIEKNYYVKEEINDKDYKQINYFGFDNDNNPLTIILSSYLDKDLNSGETYLYINLIKEEHFISNNDIINRIENIFKKYENKVEITSCIIGSFSGKFSEKDVEIKSIDAISNVNGKIVDVYKDEQLISYTAYTDSIDNNILAGDDKINLNLALRYNDFDDQTLIWIGTPIITSGY